MKRRTFILGGSLGLTPLVHGAAARAARPTTIRMWTFLNPTGTSPREVALAEIIDRFEHANQNIKIAVETQVWDQMTLKFLTAARAGRAPDVPWVVPDLLGAAIRSGELADLGPLFIDKWSAAERAGRHDAYWNACTVNGKTYGLAISRNYISILYRKDFLQQAGIDPESLTTWQKFTDAAQKLTQRNAQNEVTRWGFGQAFSEAQPDPQMMVSVMLARQGTLFDPKGRAAFATPAGIAGLTMETDMVTKAKVTPPQAVGWTVDDELESLAAGRTAMSEGAAVRVPSVRASAGGEKVELMLWPGEPGKPHSPGMASGWVVGIWTHTRHPSEAAKFVNYLTGPEADAIWVKKGGQLPATPGGRAACAEFLSQPENRYLAIAAEGIAKYGWLVPTNVNANGLREVLNKAAQDVLTRGTAPKSALLAAEQAFNRANRQ